MSYYFTGFFASPAQKPSQLPTGAVWREINAPFTGVGVKFPERDDAPLASQQEVAALRSAVGLDRVNCWVYLHYVCWGGSIDFVYGFGVRDGKSFGPFEESDWAKVTVAFIALMAQFGVALPDGGFFEPFVYGYWGERDRANPI